MISIGEKKIGDREKCFIAAEIGINHNGDMQLAKETILAAYNAGVDGVKFQNFYTEDFILDKKLKYEYKSNNKLVVETQFEMFKRYELSVQQLTDLKSYCDELELIFFSTPTSKKGILELQKIGTPLLKNGSDFLVNHELIADMAETGLPTILSTGMATIAEIDEAVRAFEKAGGTELVILHCVSSYPTAASEMNLRKIEALRLTFDYPVGFSDHSEGIYAAIGAVTLGACFIEKHFTLDKTLPGPDHGFSANPVELAELVKGVRFAEQCLGKSKICPSPKEEYGRINFRLSCVAKHNLEKGHVLTRDDIAFSRPSGGLEPKLISFILGKKLNESLKPSQKILLTNIS